MCKIVDYDSKRGREEGFRARVNDEKCLAQGTSVRSKALQGRTAYVCGHFGAILRLDAPCTELCRPGFIDDG